MFFPNPNPVPSIAHFKKVWCKFRIWHSFQKEFIFGNCSKCLFFEWNTIKKMHSNWCITSWSITVICWAIIVGSTSMNSNLAAWLCEMFTAVLFLGYYFIQNEWNSSIKRKKRFNTNNCFKPLIRSKSFSHSCKNCLEEKKKKTMSWNYFCFEEKNTWVFHKQRYLLKWNDVQKTICASNPALGVEVGCPI